MTLHLALQRMLLPSAQVSALTTGSITLPSARRAFDASKDFELIAYSVVGSDTTTISFSNISQNYTHLILMGSARTGGANTNGGFNIRWNGGTSTDTYMHKQQMYKITSTSTYGNSGTSSANGFAVAVSGNSSNSGTYGHFRVVIPTYKDTDKKRAGFAHCGYDTNTVSNGALDDGTIVNYAGTSTISDAITSLDLYTSSNFVAGSRVHLYGAK